MGPASPNGMEPEAREHDRGCVDLQHLFSCNTCNTCSLATSVLESTEPRLPQSSSTVWSRSGEGGGSFSAAKVSGMKTPRLRCSSTRRVATDMAFAACFSWSSSIPISSAS